MKKGFYKRMFSLFAVLTVMFLLSSTFYALTVESETKICNWFTEDYTDYTTSTLIEHGWKYSGVKVDFPSDSLRIKTAGGNMQLTEKSDYLAWNNYTVSCKMTVTDSVHTGTWTGNKFYAGLSFALNSSGNGYEFCLTSADEGKTFFARLYNRASKKVCCSETAVSGVSLNSQVELKAVLSDKTVACYLNSQKIFDFTANTVLTGTIGYRGGTSMVIFDDLVVSGEKEETSEETNPEAGVPDKTVIASEDFTSGTVATRLTSDNGWGTVSKSGASVVNGELRATGAFKAYSEEKFCSGTVSADICFPEEPAVLKNSTTVKTVYNGCLSARNVSASQEVRARFSLKYTPSSQEYYVCVQSVYYDAIDIGTAPKTHSYKIDDFQFGTTYRLSLSVIGNYVEISIDGRAIEQGCFSSENSLTAQVGAFGFFSVANSGEVIFDNVNIIRYKAYSAGVTAAENGSFEYDTYNDPVLGTKNVMRRGFYSGETVYISVLPDESSVMQSLFYSYGGAVVSITSKVGKDRYSFVMPSADVTVSGIFAERTVASKTVITADDFNSGTVLSANAGWGTIKGDYLLENNSLIAAETFSAYASKTFTDGGISADITIVKPADALKNATEESTVYTGNLTARNTGDKHEVRTRFSITYSPDKGAYTASINAVFYDATDFGATAKLASYTIADFAFGKSYHIDLELIGNYVSVRLDGVRVIERCFASDNVMTNHEGKFGISTVANSATVSFDNVEIYKYKTFSAKTDAESEAFLAFDKCENPQAKNLSYVMRDKFYVGELVKVNLTEPDGFTVDKTRLFYTENGSKFQITAFDSETLCGFFMPYSDTLVSGELIESGIEKNDVWFTESFDSETLMTERGWNRDAKIEQGEMLLNSNGVTKVYLNSLKGAMEWKNYLFEGDLTLKQAENDSSSFCLAAIFRCNASGNGYEFGAVMAAGQKSGYFRLYDRSQSKVLAYSATGTAKVGQKYHFALLISDKTIDCYVDNELLFTVTGVESFSQGAVGATVSHGIGTIDNITVKDVSCFSLSNSSANIFDVSDNQESTLPNTGEATIVKCGFCLSAFFLAAAMIFGLLFLKEKNGEHCDD